MKKITTLFFTFLLIQNFAFARYAKIEDAPYVLEHAYIDTVINNDGSHVETTDIAILIEKKEIIEKLGTYKIMYSPELENIRILSAYVTNDTIRTDVDLNKIQKNTLAGEGQSLINQVEIAIVFPQLKINSVIHLKYENKRKTNTLSKLFSNTYKFGDATVELDSRVKIISPYKLFYQLNDPHKKLKIEESADKAGVHTLSVSLKGPYINILTEEMGRLPQKLTTAVTVSNINDWNKIIQDDSVKLYSHLNDKLPEELQKLVSALPASYTFEQKLNYLTKYIVTNYRYTGDWRSFEGRMHPKKLDQLVKDKYGDCKDFSNLLVHLLTSIKVKADYSLVKRSNEQSELKESDLPSLNYFNHVIVRVQNEDKIYWIDPTNPLITGTNIKKDINNRLALNLNTVLPRIEYIKSDINETSRVQLKKEFNFTSEMGATVSINYKVFGDYAFAIQDLLKNKSKIELEKLFLALTGRLETQVVSEFKTNIDHLSYKNIEVASKYITNDAGKKTKQRDKAELQLPSVSEVAIITLIDKKNEGDIDLSMFPQIDNEYFYKNIYINGEMPNICDIKSAWLNASRKIELLENGIKVTDSVQILKKILTKEDYQSDSFDIVISNFRDCYFGAGNIVQYEFDVKIHNVQSNEFELALSKLDIKERLIKRLDRANLILRTPGRRPDPALTLEMARLLLEKNIQEDPTFLASYISMAHYFRHSGYLHSAIIGKDYLDRAIDTLDKALAINNNFIDANISKAKMFFYKNKPSDAKKLINEKILIYNPAIMSYDALRNVTQLFFFMGDEKNGLLYSKLALSKATENWEKALIHNYIGEYYSGINNLKSCIEFLEKSVAIDNTNAWIYGNLSSCYLRNGQFDLAITAGKNAIGILDYGIAREVLSGAYLMKGRQFLASGDYDNAEKMMHQSILMHEGWYEYLDLVKIYVKQEKMDKALNAAQKTINLYDGDTSIVVGFVAKAFNSQNAEYSSFMEQVLEGVSEKRINDVTYYVAYMLGMQNQKKEALKWNKKGTLLLKKSINAYSPSRGTADEYALLSNHHLLNLWITHDIKQLEEANKYYKIALKLDKNNPKVQILNNYIKQTNSQHREPSSIGSKVKKYLFDNFSIELPEWLCGIVND